MLFSHSYKTITRPSSIIYKDKGSKFYAFTFPVQSEDEFKIQLQKLKHTYADATHHCYALVLHPDQNFQRSTDDGEPSNTAGKPILRAIMALGITNVGVIVVRYFGGTMLGVPGLINAYHAAASEALQQCEIKEQAIEDFFELRCSFVDENSAHRFIKKLDAKIIATNYNEILYIKFSIERSKITKMNGMKDEFYFLKINPC